MAVFSPICLASKLREERGVHPFSSEVVMDQKQIKAIRRLLRANKPKADVRYPPSAKLFNALFVVSALVLAIPVLHKLF